MNDSLGSAKIAAIDRIDIVIASDNLTDVTLPGQGPARRAQLGRLPTTESVSTGSGRAFEPLVAEHGFGALVTVHQASQQQTILFDVGGSPHGLVNNLRRLQLDPGDAQAIVLSHNHFDHTAGIDGLIAALGRSELPVLVHPDFWRQRRISLPGQPATSMPSPSRQALADAGFALSESAHPHLVLAGAALLTGQVPRTTVFEVGLPHQEALIDGVWEPDPSTIDEQALVVNVRGRGLVILVGCSHPGVINTVLAAQRLTGIDAIHAVVGGFHLNGPTFAPLIASTVAALQRLRPDWLVPSHCTGWHAHAALAQAFPYTCLPGAVGTTLTFTGRNQGHTIGD